MITKQPQKLENNPITGPTEIGIEKMIIQQQEQTVLLSSKDQKLATQTSK